MSLATPITVRNADDTTTSDAETSPSTSPYLSLIDDAIAEVAKGHRRKQHKSHFVRLTPRRLAESNLSVGLHHPKG
jgi:hypothetical protein